MTRRRRSEACANSFWGLLIEPGKMYSQEVPLAFKVTMASLGPEVEATVGEDGKTISSGRTTVMLRIEDQDDYAICSLIPGTLEQQPLDLVLMTGENIAFRVCGPYPIHLTGYYIETSHDFCEDDEEIGSEYESEDVSSECDSEEAEHIKTALKSKKSSQFVNAESDSDASMSDSCEEESEGESAGSHSSDMEDVDEEMLDEYDSDFINDDDHDEEMDSDSSEESENEEIVPLGKRSNITEPSKKQQPEQKKRKSEEKPIEKKTEVVHPTKEVKQPVKVDVKETKSTATPQQPSNTDQIRIKEQAKKEQPAAKEQKPSPAKPAPKQVETPNKSTIANQPPKQPNQDSAKKPIIKTLPSGLIIEDISVGTGPKVVKDRRVGISYVGRLQSGKVFDKTQGKDLFYVNVGRGDVIKGMDIGLQGMCAGGKRRLTIPAPLAYGSKSTLDIPANSTLIFDITVEKVAPASRG